MNGLVPLRLGETDVRAMVYTFDAECGCADATWLTGRAPNSEGWGVPRRDGCGVKGNITATELIVNTTKPTASNQLTLR